MMKPQTEPLIGGRPLFRRTEQSMMAAVNEAIKRAASDAVDVAPDIAGRLPPHYFRRVALQLLFLEVCRADLDTSEDGDPGIARRVLYVGRNIASLWDGPESHHEQDSQERNELAKGADRAALRIVLRVLVEHASASDPDLRAKISAAAEAYLTELAPQSPMEKHFAELTRGLVSTLTGIPAGRENR
jgi:hypothetical protein